MRNSDDRSYGFSKGKKRRLLPMVTILMVLLALLSSCSNPATVTETPVDVTEPSGSGRPDEAEECPGESGTYTCISLSGNEITFTEVPENVFPNILPVSPEKEQELRQADKEGTECVFAIIADIAFYDTDDNLVTDFIDSPVNINYTLTDEELAEFEVCKKTLVDQELVAEPAEVQFVPVYFSNNLWKPFPEDSYTLEGNMVDVRITSWGDQPWGGGTRP